MVLGARRRFSCMLRQWLHDGDILDGDEDCVYPHWYHIKIHEFNFTVRVSQFSLIANKLGNTDDERIVFPEGSALE